VPIESQLKNIKGKEQTNEEVNQKLAQLFYETRKQLKEQEQNRRYIRGLKQKEKDANPQTMVKNKMHYIKNQSPVRSARNLVHQPPRVNNHTP